MKVLIVDDEKPARDRLRQILADEEGYDVIGEAGNGHQALELAAERMPDVVLLDIRMPGMEGIETAHHLNSMARPPAVVFTTAIILALVLVSTGCGKKAAEDSTSTPAASSSERIAWTSDGPDVISH